MDYCPPRDVRPLQRPRRVSRGDQPQVRQRRRRYDRGQLVSDCDAQPGLGVWVNQDRKVTLGGVSLGQFVELVLGEFSCEEVRDPFLPFWAMDPIVGSAASIWEKGKFRQAVSDAAGKLSALTQERLGIHDLSDYDLMAAAFNPKEPTKGRPRLRPPYNNANKDTVTSLKQGAHRLAMGVMMAIRNPATHETGDGNPIICAEQLATLSMVARWVRNWVIDRYIPPVSIDPSPVLTTYQKRLAQQQRVPTQVPEQQHRAGVQEPAQADNQTAD